MRKGLAILTDLVALVVMGILLIVVLFFLKGCVYDSVLTSPVEVFFIRDASQDVHLNSQYKLVKDFTIVDDQVFLVNKAADKVFVFDLDSGDFKYIIDIPEHVRLRISGRRWNGEYAGFRPDDEFLVVYVRVWHGLSSNEHSDTIYSEVYFREVDGKFSYIKHIKHDFRFSSEYDDYNMRVHVNSETFNIDSVLYVQYPGDNFSKHHNDYINISLDENAAYRNPFWHKKREVLYTIDNSYQAELRLVAFVQSGHF